MVRNSCSISLDLILSFSMCALISCNPICLLFFSISGIHPVSGKLHGGRCPVVVGIPSTGGSIAFVAAARACCEAAASGVNLAVLMTLVG